ncbi:MAG: hypothetical protein U1E65_27545 [Myxococcota bacterium]
MLTRSNLLSILLLAAACGAPLPEEQTSAALVNPSPPEVPAILRDVSMVQAGAFTRPDIPPFRTTLDGRVAVQIEDPPLSVYLLVPEKISAPFLTSAPGTGILASTRPFGGGLPASSLHRSTHPGGISHKTICGGDASACGADDCYDFVVFSTFNTSDTKQVELWSTPVHVRVTQPKTAAAALAEVRTGTPLLGQTLPVDQFFEPMTTQDGRLLVGRFGDNPFQWFNPNTQKIVKGNYNIVYAEAPQSAAACDLRAFSSFYPISHAPYDAAMQSRYGIARYPFRDAEGNAIPDGAELETSYPWIDRRGNNLLSVGIGATLYYYDPQQAKVLSRYPSRCLPGNQCLIPTTAAAIADAENTGVTRGIFVQGFWTHGKMVLLDGPLNNTDYGIMRPDDTQRLIALYQPGTGPQGDEPGEVRVGTGRDNSARAVPPGSARNSTLLEASENLYQEHPYLVPLAYRDVSWLVNSGHGSEELSFDDLLDPDAFIVADMSASTSLSGGPIPGRIDQHDGFAMEKNAFGHGFQREVRAQNTATSLPEHWQVPAFGSVLGGARIEPVALGGVEGRGLFLDADDHLDFSVPPQPQDIDATTWVYSLFVDGRAPQDTTARRLLTWPDGSAVELLGHDQVRFLRADGKTVVTYLLPAPLAIGTRAYTQLGLVVRDAGATVDLLIDGLRFRTWTRGAGASTQLFRLVPGTFTLGAAGGKGGFAGWYDELKVLAHPVDLETLCNHAHGSLVGVSLKSSPWYAYANNYPASAHAEISAALTAHGKATYPRYACWHDHTGDHRASRFSQPPETTSVRGDLHFPEGPLVFGQPRPDSASNAFCRSCHTLDQPPGLSVAALVGNGQAMEQDLRRQPMQPRRLIFGNIPANYVGPGLPSAPLSAPPGGTLLDQWTFPAP